MTGTTEHVVRSYYEVVGDLTRTEAELEAILHPDATLVEFPNPVAPRGARRSAEEALAAFRAGRALLSDQSFEIEELIASGERAAVRALWVGTVGRDTGPFTAGTRLTAHIAAFVTVRDGRVLAHETYDCYEPFG